MTHMGSYQIQDKYSHALLVIRLESSHTIKVSTSKIHKNKHHIHVEYIYMYMYIYICICICIYIYLYMVLLHFSLPAPFLGKHGFLAGLLVVDMPQQGRILPRQGMRFWFIGRVPALSWITCSRRNLRLRNDGEARDFMTNLDRRSRKKEGSA